MPRGANPKHEREYAALQAELEHEPRYMGHEDEAAKRAVHQRRQFDATQDVHDNERQCLGLDHDLPIAGYEHLTVPQVTRRLRWLTPAELRRMVQHERLHKNRISLLRTFDRALARH